MSDGRDEQGEGSGGSGPSAETLRVPGPMGSARPRSKGAFADSRLAARSRARTEIPVPVLKGKLFRALRHAAPLRSDKVQALELSANDNPVLLDSVELKAAAAFAGIIATNLLRHSGSRLPARFLEALMSRLLPQLNAPDLMNLEVEAYDLMQWLASSLNPAHAEAGPSAEQGEVEFDPEQGKLELVARAIAERFDLAILYYTEGRGELTSRRVTPQRLEAERYLHAYCHSRKSERVFRVSRIARVEPVRGKPVLPSPPSPPKPPATPRSIKQHGLFDDENGH